MPKVDKGQIPLDKAYQFYKENTENPVAKEVYKKVLDTWGELCVEALVEGKDIKFFSGMATVGVRKRVRPTYVDFKASREAGKEIRRSNSISNNYVAYVQWARSRTSVNSKGWKLVPSRKLQRALVPVMRTLRGHTRYVEKAKMFNKHALHQYKKKVLKIHT